MAGDSLDFIVEVVFAQNGVWSKPYSYLCNRRDAPDHLVVPTGNYMAVGRVVQRREITPETKTDGLKHVYGPASFEYVS